MASTINATTNGIVNIGDSVATLALQTGGTTAVAIDTAQIVTLSKSLALLGSTSGSVSIAAPAVAGTTTLTLPATSGTLLQSGTAVTVAQGGTGLTSTPANGALDIGNGTGFTRTTLTAGTNVTITNGAGSISIAASGGGSPGGSTTQVQYNNAGAFAGSANLTFDASTTNGLSVYGVKFGRGAGSNNADSIGIGSNALNSCTTGFNNIAIGSSALAANQTANQNIAIGYQALNSLTTAGSNNVAIGVLAGSSVTGNNNTLVGINSGNDTVILTTGTNNVIVGGYARTSSAGAANQVVLGYNLTGQADSNVTIGSSAGKIYNAFTVNATWTQTSDARLKTNVNNDSLGLSFINRLRPVTFTWKASNEIDPSLPYYNEVNQRNTTTVIHGLIAQEVKAALDAEGCSTFNGWDAGNEDTIQAISREMFISPLIKAIQELTARVAALEAK